MLSFPYLWDEGSLGGGGVEIVTWADGTDEQIVAMVAAADNGEIALTDYWAVGDEREIQMADMNKTMSPPLVSEFMNNLTFTLVIMNIGYMEQNVNFVIGFKEVLSSSNFTPSACITTNSNSSNFGYGSSDMNQKLNNTFITYFSESFRSCLKQFNVNIMNNTNYTGTISCKVSLFAVKEIIGTQSSSDKKESDLLSQIDYYKVSSRRQKYSKNTAVVSSTKYKWWTRSMASGDASKCCYIGTDGSVATSSKTSYGACVSPFMCI